MSGDALSEIPLDIQVSIIGFLDPCDILRIRKTCKSLYDATMQKVIWMEALHRVCVRNSVFLPTFPFATMSRLELEHAATSPRRWIALASRTGVKDEPIPLSPFKTRCLKPKVLDHFAFLYLVPGGRFLVTVSWDMVAVWDLGTTSGLDNSDNQLEPLALTKLFVTGMFLVHATADGLGLRIFLSTPQQSFEDWQEIFSVYEIYPQSDNPQLMKVAEFQKSSENISFFCHSLDRLIFLQGPTLNIWDYKADTWASWTVAVDFIQILVDQSSIVLLYRSGISVWSIPPLSSRKPLFSDPNPPTVPPLFTLPYPELRPIWCEGPCDWYSGSPRPHLYDLISGGEESGDPLRARRYEVVLTDDLKSAQIVERATFAITHSYNLKFESRFCENTLVSWWFDSTINLVKAHTGSIPTADEEITNSNVIVDDDLILLNTDHVRNGFAGLCPVSARLVYLDREMAIHVLDYLASPTSEVL